MVDSTKPILFVDPKRGLLEHVFGLLGEIDSQTGTTFEEVQTAFESFGFEIREEDWNFFVDQFSRIDPGGINLPELEKSAFSLAQDYLEKLGVVDFKGRFQKEGYQMLEKKVALWKGSPLATVEGNLDNLVQQHEWRRLITQPFFQPAIHQRVQELTGCDISLKENESDEEGDFVVWLMPVYPTEPHLVCGKEKQKHVPTLNDLRLRFFPRKPIESLHHRIEQSTVIKQKKTENQDAHASPVLEVYLEPSVFGINAPTRGIINSMVNLDRRIVPDSAVYGNFGLRWSGHFYLSRFFEKHFPSLNWPRDFFHNFFIAGSLSLLNVRYDVQGISTNYFQKDTNLEWAWELSTGYTIWKDPSAEESFSYLSRFDEKMVFYGGVAFAQDGWMGPPLLSIEAQLFTWGPLALIGSLEQFLTKPREGVAFQLRLNL